MFEIRLFIEEDNKNEKKNRTRSFSFQIKANICMMLSLVGCSSIVNESNIIHGNGQAGGCRVCSWGSSS